MSFGEIWTIVMALMDFNWLELLGAVTILLNLLIAFFLLIPGEEPEKTLKKILDWISKFSRK